VQETNLMPCGYNEFLGCMTLDLTGPTDHTIPYPTRARAATMVGTSHSASVPVLATSSQGHSASATVLATSSLTQCFGACHVIHRVL